MNADAGARRQGGSWTRRKLRGIFLSCQPLLVPSSLFVARAPANGREVVLTFDDGPRPDSTPRLLSALREQNVQAALFFIGRDAEAHPELVRDAVAAGQQVSNHGYDHEVKISAGWDAYIENVLRGESALTAAAPGAAARWFRPARGIFPKRLIPWAMFNGRTIALWSVDSGDAFHGNDKVLEATAPGRLRAGDVILLHEDNPNTISIIPEIVGRLREAGFSFRTLQRKAKEAARK